MKEQQPDGLSIFTPEQNDMTEIPFMTSGIAAGFPSPAEDHIDARLDLNQLLIKNKSATFFGRASGNSMKNAGISDGDILVIDKSATVRENSVLVCSVDGEFTVKRVLRKDATGLLLMPDNPDYAPIEISEQTDLKVWGVVTYVIHPL